MPNLFVCSSPPQHTFFRILAARSSSHSTIQRLKWNCGILFHIMQLPECLWKRTFGCCHATLRIYSFCLWLICSVLRSARPPRRKRTVYEHPMGSGVRFPFAPKSNLWRIMKDAIVVILVVGLWISKFIKSEFPRAFCGFGYLSLHTNQQCNLSSLYLLSQGNRMHISLW